MALHDDLLAQALHLATKERRRPKQASLRRAASAAYYALFHLLIDDTAGFVASGTGRGRLRHQLARSFEHRHMRVAASAFAGTAQNPWKVLLGTAPSGAVGARARRPETSWTLAEKQKPPFLLRFWGERSSEPLPD